MKTELVTSLKRQATRIIAKLEDDKDPILITEHGRPAAYLLAVHTFENMQTRMKILEGIARGERAIQEGARIRNYEELRKVPAGSFRMAS